MKSPFRTWSLRSRLVLGVVILSAAGFILSSVIAQQALRSYLLQQVDNELLSLSGSSLPRIAEAGIARESDDFEESHEPGHNRLTQRPRTPFQRIPTSTSVTLLDSAVS